MTRADERLREILAERDAPAEDTAFVAAVMAEAVRTAPARPQRLPALLRPFAWIACLVALGAVAPLLAGGVNAALAASDPQVLSVSLALALTAWFVMTAFGRSVRPVFAR
jgi:hypothetical protein